MGVASMIGLVVVFVFQHVNAAAWLGWAGSPLQTFLINRAIRFLLNDVFALGLIYALFFYRKYVVFAIYVQLAGVLLFLLPYFLLKLYWPAYNGPLISYLHRLILNPTLLLLLIPAFYYQQYSTKSPR